MPWWRLSNFYFWYFALLGGVGPFLALYFEHLGFSPARIGELLAMPMLMRCLAPSLWGWLGDRTGQRLPIARWGAFCSVLAFSAILLRQDYLWLMLVMAGYSFFWHALLPQFEVITLQHLGDQAARYSRIRLWGSIGFICTVVILGALLDRWSLDIYPLAMLVILLLILLASLLVPAPARAVQRHGAELASGFLRSLRRPGIPAFLLAVALMQLSHGPYYSFLSIHLESLGYSRAQIGGFWALGVVAEIVLFLLIQPLLRRVSLPALLIASLLLAALRWVLLGSLAEQLPVLLLAQLLHAATFGCFHVTAIHFVQQHFDAAHQGQGQALYATLSGLGGALGALYAGYAWQTLGPLPSFLIASVAALLAAAVLAVRR